MSIVGVGVTTAVRAVICAILAVCVAVGVLVAVGVTAAVW